MHIWRFWQRDYVNWRELLGNDSSDDGDAPLWRGQTYTKKFSPHDEQTRTLIQQYKELERLPGGDVVAPLMDEWRYLDRMASPAQKQEFLEPFLTKVASDPKRFRAELIFLMLVCEPVRRGVTKQLVLARAGLEGPVAAPELHRREEHRRLCEIDRRRLYEVTFEAVLEALYRYPSPAPLRFFPWLRATVSQRALDLLRDELTTGDFNAAGREEAEAMALALAGFDTHAISGPAADDSREYRRWRQQLSFTELYDDTQSYFEHGAVREACNAAIGRLPRAQGEVISAYFFRHLDVPSIAAERAISSSTVYNHKAQAQKRLEDDDVWFMALWALGKVRDKVRAERIKALPRERTLPDGRRRVIIDDAA